MSSLEALRLRDWLLHSGVQIAEGSERGGIAGWLEDDGRPRFAYGEVTGYYLTWAAFVASSGPMPTALFNRCHLALRWLEEQWRSGEPPPTRCHLDAGTRDWRNGAVFTFDLAMMLRGLGAAGASAILPREHCQAIATAIAMHLAGLVQQDGLLGALQLRPSAERLPAVWSTMPGPHLVKAAAAVLCADVVMPDVLRSAAERTVTKWCSIHDRGVEQHALCYGLEGLLMLSRFDDAAARTVERLAVSVATGTEGARGDVVAQVLRLLCVMAARDRSVPASLLAQLRARLLGFLDGDGACCFRPAGPDRHANAWASMFAHQALTLHDRLLAGEPADPRLPAFLT